METRHSTLSRHSKLVMQLRSATPRKNPRPFLRQQGTNVDTIFIRRIERSGRMRADRSGKRRMGHRMTVARPVPTPPSIPGSRACRAAGALRVLVMRGALQTPRCGRRASACAIRRNGGVPVARDIAARRAFYPGWDRLPRNRASRGVEGENGNRVIHAARQRRRRVRDLLRAATSMTGAVTCRSRGRKPERERPPVAILRSVKTPASSRSDQRPDARRRI